MPGKNRFKSPQVIWECMSSSLVHFVERIFFVLGVTVARNPWRTVLITWTFVILSSIGLLTFHLEKDPMKLWIPSDSDFYYDTNWYVDKFGTIFRFQKVLVTAEDVLEPAVIKEIYNVSKAINSIEVEYKNKIMSIKDLCYKIPNVNVFNSNDKTDSKKEDTSTKDFTDLSLWFDNEAYCDFLQSFQLICLQLNVLDLWSNDPYLINNVTKNDIVYKINNIKKNPSNGHAIDPGKLLGGVKYDEKGGIVSASSVLLTWFTQVNMSDVDINEIGNLVGTENWVTVPLAQWEQKFLNLMKELSQNTSQIQIFYEAGRSFADISGDAMFNDLDKLFIGILLIFFYIQFALSRCSWLEIRLTLGSVGLLCVGMAYVTAVSWCSLIGISFGPVHSSLPFLLMGLGIDDMFVMSAVWNNLSETEAQKSLPTKVGLMLKHAGVSIVITSFTDIVALLIGAITILPSLKSFCIYAAFGVFFIFCYSVTFYVAIFTLDIKRIEANRNGILFCYTHKKQIKLHTEKTIFQKMLSEFYKKIVFTVPGKTIVIILTVVVTGISIESLLKLKQKFDPKWFIPDDTYYKEFLNNYEHYYPQDGHKAMIFLGEMNYNTEFNNIYDMVQRLKSQPYVEDMVAWVDSFQGYVLANYDIDLRNSSKLSDEIFNTYLSKFLFSSIGGQFQVNFKFSELFTCGEPATNITANSMAFKFTRFHGPEEHIPAMNNAKAIVKSANISTDNYYGSVWSQAFANWVTDEVIAVEVERNIELALVCVMVCTIILITNLQMCFWIFFCVLLTIVNVLGCMQRWGMTVDIVCCIGLELAIGLCVDYAAHVGHTFLTISQGTRSERAFKTVTSIGSAVLLGGGSTLLSLSLLSMSKAYTFQSFFKIFLLVIIFGLFSGLVFLPVSLSLIGPRAYRTKDHHISMETVELNGKHKETEKQQIELECSATKNI